MEWYAHQYFAIALGCPLRGRRKVFTAENTTLQTEPRVLELDLI